MQPNPTDEIPLAESRACDSCGNATPWERVSVMGVDITKTIPCLCASCLVTAKHKAKEDERLARIEACRAQCAAVLHPRLRDTDTKHPLFNHRAWEKIKHFEVSSGQNLLLVGGSGLCKSRMLALFCKRIALRGSTIAWTDTDAIDGLAIHKGHWKTRDAALQRIDELKWAQCLVIDDLGKETMNNAAEAVLFHILNHRYERKMPTWVSANTHPSELLAEGHFSRDRGAAIVGRILEGAKVYNLKKHEQE